MYGGGGEEEGKTNDQLNCNLLLFQEEEIKKVIIHSIFTLFVQTSICVCVCAILITTTTPTNNENIINKKRETSFN